MKLGTEFWITHVVAVKRDGIPSSEYARRHGISVTALYYWQWKLKGSGNAGEPIQASKFVALRIAAGGARQSNCTLEMSAAIAGLVGGPCAYRTGNALMHPGCNIEQVYLCREPIDFRKSINGLSVLVEQELELNPFGSALYVFIN